MQTSVERKGKKRSRLRWYVLGPVLGAAASAALLYICLLYTSDAADEL